jgi:type III pantothenate kinase
MAVDVGNTQTVLGLFEDGELRGQWRLATEAHRTADELAVVFAGLLDLRGLHLEEVSAMIVSSVVPGLARSYRDLAGGIFDRPQKPIRRPGGSRGGQDRQRRGGGEALRVPNDHR